jgi:hypothetical protein
MKKVIFAALILVSFSAKSQALKYVLTEEEKNLCDTIKNVTKEAGAPGMVIETQYIHYKKPQEIATSGWVLKGTEYKLIPLTQKTYSKYFDTQKAQWVPASVEFYGPDKKVIKAKDIRF